MNDPSYQCAQGSEVSPSKEWWHWLAAPVALVVVAALLVILLLLVMRHSEALRCVLCGLLWRRMCS